MDRQNITGRAIVIPLDVCFILVLLAEKSADFEQLTSGRARNEFVFVFV